VVLACYDGLGNMTHTPLKEILIDDDFNALMGEEDEAIWRQVGLFSTGDLEGFNRRFNALREAVKAQLAKAPAVECQFHSCSSHAEVTYGLGSSALADFVVKGSADHREGAGMKSGGMGRGSGEGPKGRFTGVKKSQGSRLFKHWVLNHSKRKLMLGEDVGLEDTISLAFFTLVGRFSYKNMCKMLLEDWVSDHWSSLLGYNPYVFYLTKGWSGFHFKQVEDTKLSSLKSGLSTGTI